MTLNVFFFLLVNAGLVLLTITRLAEPWFRARRFERARSDAAEAAFWATLPPRRIDPTRLRPVPRRV